MERLRFWLYQKLVTFYWKCEFFLENCPHHKQHKAIFFEPFSTTAILTSLLISAASFGAQYILTSVLAPKPPKQIKGKLTGEITVTDSIWGADIHDIFGGRGADGIGGVEVGVNIIWLPKIDVITTTTQQPTGGGGKGGPRRQTTVTYDYKCDIAGAVGNGRLRLLRMKLNEDVVYDIIGSGTPTQPVATVYEAEDGTLSGTAEIIADSDFSGDQGVSGLSSGTLSLALAGNLGTDLFAINIAYKSTSDVTCQILINGIAATYVFSASADIRTFRQILKSLPNASNPMIFQALSAVTGLRGRYYGGENFDTLLAERVDTTVNFDWGNNQPPLPGVPSAPFTARWEGFVTPSYSETYTFSVEHDDGVKLWVNDVLIIDQWVAGPGTHTGAIALTAATAYTIKLEYFNGAPALPGNLAKCKLRWQSTSQALEIVPSAALKPPVDANFRIDAVYVEPVIINNPDPNEFPPIPTGIREEGFPPEDPQDNLLLPDPKLADTKPFERFNSAPVTNFDGTLDIPLPNGALMTWYEGNEIQPIDPVIAADLDAKYGPGSTPAFRGLAYFRIQGLYISKYGAVPQFRVVVENIDKRTVEEICFFVAPKAGLSESDLDYSAGAGKHVRGVWRAGTAEGADKLFETLATIHNLSFVETADGLHTIKDLSDRTSVATITKDDLGAFVREESDKPPIDDVTTQVEDSGEMVRQLELSFSNPLMPSDFDTDRVQHIYPYTPSVRKETKSVNAVLLPDEARLINTRELQKHHLKALAPHSFVVPYKFCWLDGGDCVEVEVDGALQKVRIEEKTGSAPGVYEISATSEAAIVLVDEIVAAEGKQQRSLKPAYPANTVGTIIDIPALSDAQAGRSGVYAACCRKGAFGAWEGAGLYREKAGEFGLMMTFDRESRIGVAVNALGNLPDEFVESETGELVDTTNLITVDFYGDYEPTSVTSLQAEDGANSFVIGSEVCVVQDWTRDNNYPNRWIGANIYRVLKFTDGQATTHVAGERIVALDDTVKFIALDQEEIGTPRDWKFVTAGQIPEDAAPISFTWGGDNLYNRALSAPVIGQLFDALNTEVRIGVKNFPMDAAFRRIEISANADLSDAAENIEAAANYNNTLLPEDFLVTNDGKHAGSTYYLRVSHSSNGCDYGAVSNILEIRFAEDGIPGTSGGFDPSPVLNVEID